MPSSETWTPDRIRSLRGDRSRAELAALVGVTPLTVYRWELPDGAAEARRPRGAVARRLAELVPPARRASSSTSSIAPSTDAPARPPEPTADELAEVLPITEHLLRGDFSRVERELVPVMATSRPRNPAVRALATQALARWQLWSRGDALGAFATLLPLLSQADEGVLPPSVELAVHTTAALVFSSQDGRLFDAGKVNAHAARAERLATSDEVRFLCWYARLVAAYLLNDPPVIAHVIERGREVETEHASPVLRCLAIEARLIQGYYAPGRSSAARDLEELLRLAEGSGLHLLHARALAQAARHAVDEATPPDRVLALVEGLRQAARQGALTPGIQQLFAAYAEGEALLRDGRGPEAERAWHEGIALAQALRWSWGSLPFFLVRSYVLTGRTAALRPLLVQAVAQSPAGHADVTRGLHEALAAVVDACEGVDVPGAIERLHAAAVGLERADVWSFLHRTLVLVGAAVGVLAGSEAQAERGLRHAERMLDTIPSAWSVAAVRWLRGLAHYRRHDDAAARPALEAALAVFSAAGDRVQVALTRHLLAALERGPRSAPLDDAELRALGIVIGGALVRRPEPSSPRRATGDARAGAAAKASGAAGERTRGSTPAEAHALATIRAAVARLSLRGATTEQVEAELLAAATSLAPGRALRLEQLDQPDDRGGSTVLAGSDVRPAAASPRLSFGDGTGRRFELTVVGEPLPEPARAGLEVVTTVAALALEVATARGRTRRAPPPAAADVDVDPPELPGFVAASPVMRRLKHDLARLAKSRATIIVTGESGAGKEVVARAIHDLSVRAARPYVAFNCAAVPRDLFEGQLFGHRKGAFTGAASDQAGVIRAAAGGTLFLDEIAELPLEVQPKLLRFLENGEVFPLGAHEPVRVDVRVIAATFRSLEQRVREGKFREDLFYRLQVLPLHVPPLRERPEDVAALARHLVERLTPPGHDPPALSADALDALLAHDWPGNVRELRNVIERSLAFEPWPAVLGPEHLRIR